MRFFFWLIILSIVALLVRDRWLHWRRRMRGEPQPKQQGPRTVTLVVIAIALVYGSLIGYRLLVGD